MLFNSVDFAFFLPIVFTIYWGLRKHLKIQNLIIVIASYIFYGMWDWRFLFLILSSTLIDYYLGLKIAKSNIHRKQKLLLFISLLMNLGCLAYFKYFNFFLETFVTSFSFFGRDIHFRGLEIVLPVGISFYTFQTLSYTIDVYRKKLTPTHDFIAFSAFVSFFPQLVAGPIERATNLLPQFLKKRKFNVLLATDGLRQILWGMFKKVVVADNCARYATIYFQDYENYSGLNLVLGTVFFAFQIYGDFSGYSDIAIGTARLFGFDLMKNFAYPYFARDVAEFWRKWHISLTTWFRDYLYIPLGGSRVNAVKKIRNIFIIFIVSGFWHGANWTFIAWGALNALYFIPLLFKQNHRKHLDIVAEHRKLPNLKEILQMSFTFTLIGIGWIFFRSESINHALNYLARIFQFPLFELPSKKEAFVVCTLASLIIIEWVGRKHKFALESIYKQPVWLRWTIYLLLGIAILIFWGKPKEFIYFQF